MTKDFLLVSDLHVDAYSKFSKIDPKTGMNSRLFWTIDVFDHIKEYGEENDCKILGIGGDIFDKRGSILVSAYDAVYDKLLDFLKDDWFVFSIVGNHDMSDKTGVINSLRPLPMETVESYGVIEMPNGLTAGCVSFCETPGEFLKKLEKVYNKNHDFYLIHQGVNRAIISGDEILSRNETEPEAIREIVGNDAVIFSGHYHIRQSVDDNFHYIGSATPKDFGDKTPKGFLHIHEGGSIEQIESRAPKFIVVEAEELKSRKKELAGNYIQVRYDGKEPDLSKIDNEGYICVKRKVDREYEERSSIEPDQSPISLIDSYVDEMEAAENLPEGCTKDDLMTALQDIVGEKQLEQLVNGHKIEIQSIQINNFMRFREQSFHFTDYPGMVLVEGENKDDPSTVSNGAGKSTVFEAVKWCLFGTTSRGLTGDEVINSTVGKDCFVAINVILDGTQEYIITRSRKDSAFNTQLQFNLVEGEDFLDLREKSDSETQKKIIRTLGIDESTFDNVVFFAHGYTKSFAALTDKEQKAILENILGVEYFRDLYDAAKGLAKSCRDGHQEEVVRLGYVKKRIEEEQDNLINAETEQTKFEESKKEKIEGYKEEIAEHKEFIDTVGSTKEDDAKIKELEKQITALGKDTWVGEESIDTIRRRKKLAEDEWKKAEKAYVEAKDHKTEKENEAFQHLLKIDANKKEIKNINSSETCPTCGQDLKTKTGIKARIKELKDENKELEVLRKPCLEKVKEFEKAMDIAEMDLEKYERVLRKANEKLDGYVDVSEKVSKLEAEKAELVQDRDKIKTTLGYRKSQIEKLKDSIKKEKAVENPINEIVKRHEAAMDKAAKEANEVQDLCDSLERNYSLAKFWELAFSDKGSKQQIPIKSFIFDSVVPVLDELGREYSEILTSGSMELRFNTVSKLKSGEEREKFSVTVTNSSGASSYKGDSGGERRKVDLAIMFALYSLAKIRSGSRVNLLCLDEILDSLDSEGCERVMMLLRKMSEEIESIFVITHNESLKRLFGSKFVVRKEGGVSKIVQD